MSKRIFLKLIALGTIPFQGYSLDRWSRWTRWTYGAHYQATWAEDFPESTNPCSYGRGKFRLRKLIGCSNSSRCCTLSEPLQQRTRPHCRGGALPTNLKSFFAGSKTRCWLALFWAIVMDSYCTSLMKSAQDEGSVFKLLMAYSGYFVSLFSFGLSLHGLDMSLAYAAWGALGTAVVSAIGIIKFNEDCDPIKLCCLAMIVFGVFGLNLRDSS